MRSIRGGSGLGDALYVQSVARHFVGLGERVEVCSDWPDVFLPLGERAVISGFRRDAITTLAHYSAGRRRRDTTQWEDVCFSAGILSKTVTPQQRLDWRICNREFELLRADERPIMLVQLPREPFDRGDNFGIELLPMCKPIQMAIDLLRRDFKIVQVGKGKPLYKFMNIDVDMANKTSVRDLIDIASIAEAFVGYVSYFVPLAESLGKPALFVWSSRGINSRIDVLRQITPQKVLHCQSSRFVIDDSSDKNIEEAVDAFRWHIRSRAAA